MKYKVEYMVEGDGRVHRRYYNALDRQTAQEMFHATMEHSLGGVGVIGSTIKIYQRDKNKKWKE